MSRQYSFKCTNIHPPFLCVVIIKCCAPWHKFLFSLTCYRFLYGGEGPRSSLKADCATLWWRWRERWSVLFFQVMEHRWNEIDRRIPKYLGGKIRPSATLSTTNPTSTDPGSNTGLRGDRPATNRLSHGTAVCYDISDRRLENAVILKLCLKREADDFCTCRICSSCMPWEAIFFEMSLVARLLSVVLLGQHFLHYYT